MAAAMTPVTPYTRAASTKQKSSKRVAPSPGQSHRRARIDMSRAAQVLLPRTATQRQEGPTFSVMAVMVSTMRQQNAMHMGSPRTARPPRSSTGGSGGSAGGLSQDDFHFASSKYVQSLNF